MSAAERRGRSIKRQVCPRHIPSRLRRPFDVALAFLLFVPILPRFHSWSACLYAANSPSAFGPCQVPTPPPPPPPPPHFPGPGNVLVALSNFVCCCVLTVLYWLGGIVLKGWEFRVSAPVRRCVCIYVRPISLSSHDNCPFCLCQSLSVALSHTHILTCLPVSISPHVHPWLSSCPFRILLSLLLTMCVCVCVGGWV